VELPIVLFLICAVLLLGTIYMVWRYWDSLARISPEEEAFDERVASLNERQAHRVSDEELAQPPSEDEAWQIMVSRGRRAGARQRRDSKAPLQRINRRRRAS
jgi:hypothetical protein